jgi:hypothetical protein
MIELGKVQPFDLRKLFDSEPRAFTPWLASNINLLSQALGIDLELLQTEKAVGDFSCDIQARDIGRDRPVIIENQLEPTDHRHLGQLLTYAAGLDAAVIVWISPEVRDEHREALDWLNRRTDDRLEFFGVSLEAVQIDDSKPAVQFKLVAFPNAWTKAVTTENRREVSELNLRYKQFFQGVIDELREAHRFTNARIAQAQNWYALSKGGFTYSATFTGDGRLRAALEISKAVFDQLQAQMSEVENRTGQLEWERLDQNQLSRISLVRPNTSIDDAMAQADEVRAWLVQALLKLNATFGPLLEAAIRNLPANRIE